MTSKLTFRIIVLLLLITSSSVFAQDDEAHNLIISAVEQLADGYAYTAETSNTQQLVSEADELNFSTQEIISAVEDAEGNFYVSRTISYVDEEVNPEDIPPFTIELISLDENLYINFSDISLILQDPSVEDGWQSYDDLIALLEEDSVTRIALENIVNVFLLSDLPLNERYIDSVTELEVETIDGQVTRVFEVEIDAFQYYMSFNPLGLEQVAELFLEGSDLLTASEFSLMYTVWIGQDDGFLYRGESQGHSYSPYFSTSGDDFSYDITVENTTIFSVSDHGIRESIQEIAGRVGIQPAP